jgi:DNA-binding transcriptional LysR family regulator
MPAVLTLRAQRPAVRMQISIGLNDQLLSSLRLGDLDLTISALGEDTIEDLDQEALFQDDFCIVARKSHPLAQRTRLTLADLAPQPWLLPRKGVFARRQIEAKFAQAALPAPLVAVEVSSSVSQLVDLVRQSDVITLLGERMLRTTMGNGLVALHVKNVSWNRKIGVSTRRSGYLTPLASRFMDILRGVAHDAA